MKKKLKKDIKKTLKNKFLNREFLTFMIASLAVVLALVVFKNIHPLIKIISLIAFAITNFEYNYKNRDSESSDFVKFINSFGFGMMVLLTIVYISLYVGNINLTIALLFITFFAMMGIIIAFNFIKMLQTENLVTLAILYSIFSITIIMVFGFIYTTYDDENSLIFPDNINKTLAWDEVYFSSSVYFSNSLGEIIPRGNSRTTMQIESGISHLFHIIILGYVIGRVKKIFPSKSN